jgi:MCP family monocarboxylic acid transporter-like MFS transporter 10
MGVLSDRFSPWLLGVLTLLSSSLVTFLIWGVAGSAIAGVMVFGVAYGLLAGGWTSIWTGFVRPLASMYTCPVLTGHHLC